MMGLAIYHRELLSVYFTRSFYKHILGKYSGEKYQDEGEVRVCDLNPHLTTA